MLLFLDVVYLTIVAAHSIRITWVKYFTFYIVILNGYHLSNDEKCIDEINPVQNPKQSHECQVILLHRKCTDLSTGRG